MANLNEILSKADALSNDVLVIATQKMHGQVEDLMKVFKRGIILKKTQALGFFPQMAMVVNSVN